MTARQEDHHPGDDGFAAADSGELLSRSDPAAYNTFRREFHHIWHELDRLRTRVRAVAQPGNLVRLDPAVAAAVQELGAAVDVAKAQAAAAVIEYTVSNAWLPDRDGIRRTLGQVFGVPTPPVPPFGPKVTAPRGKA